MNACSGDAGIIQQLQSLESRFLSAISSGVDACSAFSVQLESTLAKAQQLVHSGQASSSLLHLLATFARPLNIICSTFVRFEHEKIQVGERQANGIQEIFTRVSRRRRKRSTRSRKSKAGKNGRVRQSGKKSKRGRKSPVGNPKRRVQAEAESSTSGTNHGLQSKPKPTMLDSNGKRCRTVTAPPTDSMKFGPCRDFFLSHLGDPYPTTVQKHQILKQSSPDFTLRSLNLWFVNIRRRSKWMDIFKKHAGSKRDAMRDLVARVEAQVAGRPAPNPLPSGATPPGLKVEQDVVEEVMAMRAVVDMVSREVYGEGWDQILQIKPWTDEEVRAHEERKKAARREARASKADVEKRKRERDEQREQRKRERENRKLVEQEAVEGIRAARELHGQLMASNKRKRDDGEEESQDRGKRFKKGKEIELDENGQPKQRKIRVPKVDEQGNPLTREQRKAIKKAILASQTQANPLKRKSPEHDVPSDYPGEPATFPEDVSPSKRRRRDAVTFDGFPTSEEIAEAGGMVDLTQLFAVEWASPPRQPEPLPTSENTPSPISNSGYNEFANPSDSQVPVASMQVEQSAHATTEGEVPRRFSQQLAAYALESGMFDGESFELFTEDTFPGMAVDVNADNTMGSLLPPAVPHHQGASMSVSPAQTAQHTPIPGFAAPIQTQQYDSFGSTQPHGHTPPSPYSTASTITPTNGDADSDMSWINAALAQLPSEHDTQHQMHQQYTHAPSSQEHMQHPIPQPSFTPTYESNSIPHSAHTFPAGSDRRAPVSHQRTPLPFPSTQNSMPPPPAPSTSPSQPRRSFPHPQARPAAPQQAFQAPPQPQSQPQQRQRAPGELWQTPYSQPAPLQPHSQPQQHYSQPTPSPTQSHSSFRSFPAPLQQQNSSRAQYNDLGYERQNAYNHPKPPSPEHRPAYEQEYHHTPIYPPSQHHQYSHTTRPASQASPSPISSASDKLKQHELEFARAQEELQNRFKREQEEQLARFMRAQEDLRKQLLAESQAERR